MYTLQILITFILMIAEQYLDVVMYIYLSMFKYKTFKTKKN